MSISLSVHDVDDELDLLSAPISRVRISSAAENSSAPLRRSGRARQSSSRLPATITSASISSKPKLKKRKSAPAVAESEASEPLAKKQKSHNSSLFDARKNARDLARNIWLQKHEALFAPILPNVAAKSFVDAAAMKAKASYTPFHELDEQPMLIKGGLMKEYQLHGLSYLANMHLNGMNSILGDEMGLGKTLQTLSLFAWIRENEPNLTQPHLVVCPLSVLSSWENESSRWLPSFKIVRFHGAANERARLRETLKNAEYDIIITTYETFSIENTWFKSRPWAYFVLDEGHKIKNAGSEISHKVQGLGSLHRLLLTGTPVQNNLLELWALFHFLYPSIFTAASERMFKEAFDLTNGKYELPFVSACQKLLSAIMLRRTKDVISGDVPPREELTVFIPLSEAQRFWTYRLLTRVDSVALDQIFKGKLDDDVDHGRREVLSHLENQVERHASDRNGSSGSGNKAWSALMNLLMQLRRVCSHPYMLANAEPDPYYLGEHLIASSSKMIAIDKILADVLPKGEKVLMFSQWTGMLDLLEDMMNLRGIPYARLDGSTSRARRSLDIRLFQQEKSPYKVYLVSTQAGGLGINLTKASTVIMVDSSWNPQNDLQAVARAHRIGQKKVVKVYRLICRGSVEDQMLDRVRRKLFLSVKLMTSNGSDGSDDTTGMSSGEVMKILRQGSSALSNAGDGMDWTKFLSSPIADILEASRVRETARDAKMKKELGEKDTDEAAVHDAQEEEKQLLSGVAQVQSRLFEGKMVTRMNNADIKKEWNELTKRAKTDRTVYIGGMAFIADAAPEEPEEIIAPKPTKKTKKPPIESEDYCIHCRDGGELICCAFCPRVFHESCRGLTKTQLKSTMMVPCAQHSCWDCQRNTTDAGGMLYRCRSCPRALCEDCLPAGELDIVGEQLPEYEVRNHTMKPSAYYIRCAECHEYAKEDPGWEKDWQDEWKEAEEKLKRIRQE